LRFGNGSPDAGAATPKAATMTRLRAIGRIFHSIHTGNDFDLMTGDADRTP
jgi:hypothetical protein